MAWHHYPVGVQGFGVDIGGSGIKGCLVDLDKGQLVGERVRIETPQPSLPDAGLRRGRARSSASSAGPGGSASPSPA